MKNPDRRQAESGFVGEQLYLIDPPPFSPTYPNRSTLAGKALTLFLQGRAITTPDFQEVTRSWRLAAYAEQLINKHGWPIVAVEVPFADDPRRSIARYSMPKWVIRELGATHG